MASVLGQPIAKSSVLLTPPKELASPEVEQQAAPSADFDEPQGSKLDGLLIWICFACWLLLWAMHVYEVLAWAVA